MESVRAAAVACAVGLFSHAPTAAAQTEVGGPILSDTDWTTAGSPYLVTTSIIIGADAVLFVEPGVRVEVGDGLSITVGSAPFGAGGLVARGTIDSPIIFTGTSATPGQWNDLFFTDFSIDGELDPATGAYVSGSLLEHVETAFGGGGTNPSSITIDQSSPVLRSVVARDSASRGIQATLVDGVSRPLRWRDVTVRDNAGDGFELRNGENHIFEGLNAIDNGGGGSGSFGREGIDIDGADGVTIDGGVVREHGGTGLSFGSSANAVVRNMTFSENSSTPLTFNSSQAPRIESCAFLDNATGGSSGGGIQLSSSGAAIISESDFERNAASTGAAIWMSSARDVAVIACSLVDNEATSNGGAVYLSSSSSGLRVQDCTFDGNSASGSGGAIWINDSSNATARVEGSTFVSNAATVEGGAIYFGDRDARIEGTQFIANTADRGGAVYVDRSAPSISFAGDPVGGIFNTFFDNTAISGQGDAIYNELAFNPDGSGDVNARNVCWGTDSQGEVQLRIWDFFDDATLGFIIATPLIDCDVTEPCRADLDGDGELTIFDFLAFQNAFDAMDPVADFDKDGEFTIFDFLAFQNEFDLGCP